MGDPFRDLKKQLADMTAELSRLQGEERELTFGEFALEVLKRKEESPTLRASTKKAFRNQVRAHLIPAFGALPLEKITSRDWLAWVRLLRSEKELEEFRFFNARKALIEILNAAKEDGHLRRVPKLEQVDEKKDVGRALDELEVLRILKRTSSRHFRFLFYVLWKTGFRPREVLQWEWSMFEWNEPGHTWLSVPARITKTARARKVPVNPSVSRRLYREYSRAPAGSSRFVFPHPEDPARPQLFYHSAWKTACRLAKVSAVPYDLRRTFITRCAAEGKPLIYVAKALDTSTKMIEATYAKAQAEVMERIVK